jgi:hypothetical protein
MQEDVLTQIIHLYMKIFLHAQTLLSGIAHASTAINVHERHIEGRNAALSFFNAAVSQYGLKETRANLVEYSSRNNTH